VAALSTATAWSDESTNGLRIGEYETYVSSASTSRQLYEQQRRLQQQGYQNQLADLLNRRIAPPILQPVGVAQQSVKQEPVKKGQSSMVDEFKSYVREYKDWIFTIAIVAVIDHFFLDGALKEKLSTALGRKLDADNAKA
jgi:hypothetical protein